MFSNAELRRINRMRALMREAQETAARSAHRRNPPIDIMDPDAWDYSRFATLAEVAEDALFDLLNWTNASGIQKISDNVMHMREGAKV